MREETRRERDAEQYGLVWHLCPVCKQRVGIPAGAVAHCGNAHVTPVKMVPARESKP